MRNKLEQAQQRILFLDTSDFDFLKFGLAPLPGTTGKTRKKGKTVLQRHKIHHFDSEKTLPALIKFLKKNKVVVPASRKSSGIAKIILVSGPGSFSGLRVGASIALALSFAWNVPVYAIEKSAVPRGLVGISGAKLRKVTADFEPDYGFKPKITKEKPKQLKNT